MNILKQIEISALVAIIVVFGYSLVGGNNQSVGSDVNTRHPHGVDVTESGAYAVDGTVVIDENGNVDAPITTTTGTFSGDFAIDTLDLFVDVSTNKIGIGTSTPQSTLHLEIDPTGDGTVASTTLEIGQVGTTTSVGQIQMKQSDGGVSCVYLDAAGTSLVAQDGACTD